MNETSAISTPGAQPRHVRRAAPRRKASWRRRLAASVGALAVAATSAIVPAAIAAPDAAALAAGVVMVDANGDGAVTTTGRAGEVDKPLAGVTVTLKGSDPQHPGWSTQTAADGSWSFSAEEDYSASPGPFTVSVDVAGVAGDVYAVSAPGAANEFTRVDDQPQRAVSAQFEAGDEAVVLDGLVYPVWGFDLALANDPDGYGRQSIYTGSAPFDADDTAGNDSSATNSIVRTGDVVAFNWSLTAASHEALGDSFPNAAFEQTITLEPGAVANFARVPAICETGSITAYPSGKTISPRTDPPAGTESVVLTCDLGRMGEDRAAILMPTNIWVSGGSMSGAEFGTSARIYATDVDGAATARPSAAVEAGPFEITAAPRYDLKKWGSLYTTATTATFNGVPNTRVFQFSYVVTLSTDRKVGIESLRQPITLEEDFWAQYTSGQNGEIGTVVPDLQYQLATCAPVYSGNLSTTTVPVWGRSGGTGTDENTVSNSGTCTATRDDPGDLTSGYTLKLDGIDTTGARFPTKAVNGADLSAGPFYVGSYLVTIYVPMTEADRLQGPVDDGSGSLTAYNRVGGFDPVGVSGTSNYGDGVEPGFCAGGPSTDGASNCQAMEDTSRSNNVVGPNAVTIGTGTWAKYAFDNTSAWTSSYANLPQSGSAHDGAGQVQPGEVHGTRLGLGNSGLTKPLTNPQQCDVFDNTMVRLAPLRGMVKSGGATIPENLYSYVLRSDYSVAANQAYTENFIIEYAHVDLTGDGPDLNTFDPVNNRWEGDWTRQRAASTCSRVPESDWQTDPHAVGSGIDDVNIVRMRPKDTTLTIPPGTTLYWWLAFQQRDRFYGGPYDGESIPAGTVFANFGNVRSDEYLPTWATPSYVPGAGMTGGTHQKGENTGSQGDRWTVTRATMALSKRTIAADVDGVTSSGAADFGTIGTALAGRPLVWEVTSSLSAGSETPAPVSDVVITDTLPAYAVYDEAATAALEGGTPASSYEVNEDGTTTLVWNLGSLIPNQPIPPRRIVTDTDPLAPNNTTLVNTATITADGIVPVKAHTDDHTVRLEQTGEVQLKKSVDRTLDLQNGNQAYTLQMKNFSETLAIQAPTVIDVLSYTGDSRGNANVNRAPASDYAGVNRLAGPPEALEFDGTTPLAGTFYYTKTNAAEVPQSLNDDDPSIWSTEFTADATAFKFVADGPLATTGTGSRSGLTIRYTTEQRDNAAGDLYANRFTAFSNTLMNGPKYQLLTSNQTTVRVLGFSLGDFVWTETDFDGKYTPGVDTPAPQGVQVEVFNAEGDTRVASTVTDERGRWVVNDLPRGDYFAVIPASQFAAGAPLAGLLAYPGAHDPNGNVNEDHGHDGVAAPGGGVRTGIITLDATVGEDGSISGDEPLGDNVGSVKLTPLTTDDFTNLTLDVALYRTPGYEFTKTADPASGTQVLPGDEVTYTVTGTNTGGTPLRVDVTDDLSGVLEHADVVDGSLAASVEGVTGVPAPSLTGTTLSWSGTLQPGQSVVVTYSVTLHGDAWGITIRNHASSTATPPAGPVITPPDVVTEHPTPGAPGYEFTKAATPVSETSVLPGDEVAYTVTGTNTGATSLRVDVTDDLSAVLEHADLVDGSLAASIEGVDGVAAPTLDGTTLSWSGALEPGQSVVLTYTVTLHDDAWGITIRNLASSTATPPVGPAITPPDVETEHPTPEAPGYEFTKTAAPASETSVLPGDEVTYTVTGTNTGGTPLDVTIGDDLSGVLANADLDTDSVIAQVAGSLAAAPTLDGTTLSWSGALEPGQSVVLTYTVTLHDDAWGITIRNLASSTATPPAGPAITPPDVETEHPTPEAPGYEFSKTADPVSGTSLLPGGQVAYQVTGTNTGGTPLDVTIGDDLSAVLEHANLVDGSLAASIEGVDGVAAPTVDGSDLSWTGTLEPGQSVVLTYTVTLHDDAWGITIRNLASSTATPPVGPAITPPDVETEHPTPEAPGYEFTKAADPVSGTDLLPGDQVAYTVTGTNTGGTPLDVIVTDDLSGVLANADLVDGSLAATIEGVDDVPAPTVDGATLSWSGALEPGQSAVITYTVMLHDDAWGITIRNLASSTATPPVGPAITPPDVETEHPTPQAPGYEFSKTADPVSGTAVAPGGTIAYTLTGTNTGGTPLDVVITDDLSGVLAHAVLDPVAIVEDLAEVPAPVVDGTTLSWSGTLAPGQSVRITYVVQLDADAWGVWVNNLASSTATPPVGDPITPDPVETRHPTPGYGFTKTADPESGTAVDPGQEITYTLTGSNTGVTVLDPVQITDDLSKVLAHADLVDGSLTASIDGVDEVPVPVVDGSTLSWTGRLEPGQVVQVTYTVRVHDDAQGVVLRNHASSSATPPDGLAPLTPPDVETFHPTPGYTFVKTADPVSGTPVPVGGQIGYTLTGTNYGATVLDPVQITDDLSEVLAHADLVDGSLTATIEGVDGVAPPTVDGTTLSWTGRLEPGQTVRVTYTVAVKPGSEGATLHNVAKSVAIPPTGTPIMPPPEETEHPVPGYTFAKTSNPGDGATLAPGAKVTYTLTGGNTGASRLDGVTITDDLARVLNHASLDGDPVATITGPGGATRAAAAPIAKGTTLSWSGALAAGETVAVTYTITVDADCPATTLVNVAVSSATPPGNDPITPPKDDTEHPVVVPDGPVPPATPGKTGQTSGPSWLPHTGAEIGATLAVTALLVGAGVLLVAATRSRRRRQ